MKRLLATLLLLATAATSHAADRLRIGHDAWIGYAAAMVARDKGLFRKEGLEVKTVAFAGPGDTLAPLISGHLDVAFTTLFNLALMSAKGNDDLVAIYLLDTSNGADAVVAAKGIDGPAQLKGRKIAVTLDEVNHMLLIAALERGGVKPAEAQLVNFNAEDAGAALLAGKVDAAVTWEPWVTRAKGAGGKVVFSSADTPNLILDAVVVRKDVLASKGPLLARLLRGIDAGHAFLGAKPKESRAVLAKWLKVSPAEVADMLAGDKVYGLAENRALFGTPEKPGPAYDSMKRVAEFISARGLRSWPLKPETLLVPALVAP
jgi:NitT/TauT family transport system substrate-binding protein